MLFAPEHVDIFFSSAFFPFFSYVFVVLFHHCRPPLIPPYDGVATISGLSGGGESFAAPRPTADGEISGRVAGSARLMVERHAADAARLAVTTIPLIFLQYLVFDFDSFFLFY